MPFVSLGSFRRRGFKRVGGYCHCSFCVAFSMSDQFATVAVRSLCGACVCRNWSSPPMFGTDRPKKTF